MERYCLSSRQFHSLASGQGQPGAMRILADGQLARRRLLILAITAAVRRHGGAALPSLEAALALIGLVERRAFAVARRVLSYPNLPVWAGRILVGAQATSGDRDSAVTAAGYLCALAASAAASAGISFDITVPTDRDVLVLPMLGAARGIGRGPFRVRGDGTRVVVTGREGDVRITTPFQVESRHWWPLRRITVAAAGQRLTLVVDDIDPHRDCYAWRPTGRLGLKQCEELRDVCLDAWRLVVRHHPWHATAMRAVLRSLVPLEPAVAGDRLSATSQEAVGAIAVSLPTDPESLVELLLHEFQHLKLGALSDLVELYLPGAEARHYAPWRPDPRPVTALLQGAYAHLGVTEYWRFRRSRVTGAERVAADQEFAYWRLEVSAALTRLRDCGELTELGEAFVGGLAEGLRPWQADPLPTGAETAARSRARSRAAAWRQANPRRAVKGLIGSPTGPHEDSRG